MTLIFILGVGAYFLTITAIGYFCSRQCKTFEDYLIAGRSLPLYLAVPTVVATWFGAGASMGVSGTVYSDGFYGVISDPFGCTLALLITGLFFAIPFRRLRLLTISDLLRRAYGREFEMASTLAVIPFYVGTLASQMLAMGYIFQIVSGVNLEVGILVGSLVVIFYTVVGGMWAVTLTDFIQFILLGLGLIILLPMCIDQVPNKQVVFDQFLHEFGKVVPRDEKSIDWFAYGGRIFMTGLGAIMGQDLLQRLLACRNEQVARNSSLIGACVYFLLGLIPLYIGLAGRQIYPDLEVPEQLIPILAKENLSPLLFTLFACGLLSAIMSTADSYLLAGASLLTNNFFLKMRPLNSEKEKITLIRWVSITLSLIALTLAFSGHSIFDMMVHSGATLFVCILVGSGFGTSLAINLWSRREIFHHARLGESIIPFNSNTQETYQLMEKVGFNSDITRRVIDQAVEQQAYMLSTNELSWLAGWMFLALIPLIYCCERVQPGQKVEVVH